MTENDVLDLLKGKEAEPIHNHIWFAIEKFIGSRPPDIYIDVMDRAEDVILFGFIMLPCPISRDGGFSCLDNVFVDFSNNEIKRYKKSREIDAKNCMFPIWDEPGGIVPIGVSENGNTIFYRIEGEIEEIIVYDEDFLDYEVFKIPLREFLLRFINGDLEFSIFSKQVLLRQGWPLRKLD